MTLGKVTPSTKLMKMMCKPAPTTSNDETITNGLSLEGVHVGAVNLMISLGTVILILFVVFFYFYCKGRRGFCGPPSTSAPSPPAPANAHAGILPPIPTSPVLNGTEHPAKP